MLKSLKNKTQMKKIIFLILIGLIKLMNAQQQSSAEMNLGITQPNPTAASMSSYANVPVSFQTGVPNISYDLFSIPTNNKKVNIKLALNYHAGGIGTSQWVGDMGQGWSLLGLGAFSREINDDIDERFNQNFPQWHKKNIFDDIYSFSTLDESGRFRFVRDTVNNIFSMKPLSDFESKIEYERTNDNLTLLLQSFTVTNTSGIKYKFNTYDSSVQKNVFMHYYTQNIKAKDGVTDSLVTFPKYLDLNYRSAFRLTSIIDENNTEIVKYHYEPYNDIGTNSITQKLKTIEIIGRGKIEINYNSDPYPQNRNHEDLNIGSIVLKDTNNAQIQKYTFAYAGDHAATMMNEVQPRQLTSYSKIDKNGNVIDTTLFDYSLITYPIRPASTGFSRSAPAIAISTNCCFASGVASRSCSGFWSGRRSRSTPTHPSAICVALSSSGRFPGARSVETDARRATACWAFRRPARNSACRSGTTSAIGWGSAHRTQPFLHWPP